MNTVNVIEHNGEIITNLRAFPDTPEGNRQAESIFSKIAIENGASNIPFHLENGWYSNGDYTVYLVHST